MQHFGLDMSVLVVLSLKVDSFTVKCPVMNPNIPPAKNVQNLNQKS